MAERKLLKSVTIKRGKDTPAEMCRGSAAAADGKCYFISHEDTNIRVYDAAKDDWFSLRQSLYKETSLAIIGGLPTTVGGEAPNDRYEHTNRLHSLSNRRWTEKFPSMTVDPALGVDNKKCNATVVQTGSLLIVIGGQNNNGYQKRVDVLDTATSVWSGVHQLPSYCFQGSATICGDVLYVENNNGKVYRCLVDDLMDGSKPAASVWTPIADPRAGSYCTLSSLSGQLVAIGGKESRSIDAYNSENDCWYEIGLMGFSRARPLVAQLSKSKLVVVGGSSRKSGSAADVTLTEIITDADANKKFQ